MRLHNIHFLLFTLRLLLHLTSANGEETRWTSKQLTYTSVTETETFRAQAVTQDGKGNLLIAVKLSSTEHRESSAALFKVDSAGGTIWTVLAQKVEGTPFDISVDSKTGSAFIVVSESKRRGNYARAHVIQFINIFAQKGIQQQRIEEKVFFSTPGTLGTTKLFGCVRHPSSGDLYVTGGTSASLYRTTSLGKGDAIIVRLDSAGNILASAQFGSEDDEVGRSISMNADGSALAVVTKRQSASGLSTSEIYRLDPNDLSIIDGPHSPYNHGSDPLFNPKSIAIAGPIASQPNTLVTFVSGDAVVKPDRRADIYIHIHAKVADRINDVTVSFDGAKNKKGIDSCDSIRIGSDGNAYCIGYTEINGNPASRSLNLIVVAPTGELLYKEERKINDAVPIEETPVGLSILESNQTRKLVYVGHARFGQKMEPTIGFIEIPKGTIRTFSGFGDIVKGAGTVIGPQPNEGTEDQPSIGVIAGGAAGGVVVLVAVIAGFVLVDQRRRNDSDHGMTTTARSTGDYNREVEETFTDAMTPCGDGAAGGALV